MVFNDVFGYETVLYWAFADDTIANSPRSREGTTSVLIPDFFRGNPIAQPILNSFLPDFVGLLTTLPAFLYRLRYNHPPEDRKRNNTQLIFPWIQSQVPYLSEIGTSCVRLCFEGLGHGKIVEGVHWGSEADVMKNTGWRLLPAGNDPKSIKVCGKHIKALANARDVAESTISEEYPDMKHGRVSRGDGTIAAVARCQEGAMCAIVVKFLEHTHV